MFGALGKSLGSVFGNQSKFNPMNAPGLKQIGSSLGMRQSPTRPMGQPQGIGPSMPAMGGFMQQMKQKPPGMAPSGVQLGGGQPGGTGGFMKPPQMGGGAWNQMPGMNTGMKPNIGIANEMGGGLGMPPPGYEQQGGIGPSMPAMQNMLQQPEQSQQPAAAGPMPDFMNKFGGQPLNRGYGRM